MKQYCCPPPKPHIAYIKYIDLAQPISETDHIIDEIRTAREDKAIHGILLQVNCPGGPAGQSEHLYREIKLLNTKKPVVALVNNIAASGGYMASCAAEWIIAPSTSTIGSIGVRTSLQHATAERFKHKIASGSTHEEVISTGTHTTFNPHAENADIVRNQKNLSIHNMYDIFLALVADARNLDKTTYLDWAEGKVFDAEEALQLHLIDEIGTYSHACNKIKALIEERHSITFDTISFA
jgi:protease-4